VLHVGKALEDQVFEIGGAVTGRAESGLELERVFKLSLGLLPPPFSFSFHFFLFLKKLISSSSRWVRKIWANQVRFELREEPHVKTGSPRRYREKKKSA
jgi:hypothetical protein